MKNTSFLFAWLSLFLIISLSALAKANAASLPPVVRDSDNNPLRQNARYYILPVIRGRGGGVTLTIALGKNTCPLGQIIQDRRDVNRGIPVIFSPLNTTAEVVHESTDLNIRFSVARRCDHSTFWRIGKFDESSKNYFLTTGGTEGNPGRETIDSWFKIEKLHDIYYKLFYCPTVCVTCKVICRDVGIYIQDGKRRLALADEPFSVMFKRV